MNHSLVLIIKQDPTEQNNNFLFVSILVILDLLNLHFQPFQLMEEFSSMSFVGFWYQTVGVGAEDDVVHVHVLPLQQ